MANEVMGLLGKRQRDIAWLIEDKITERKGVSSRLVRRFEPFGAHSSFCPPLMPLDDNFLDARMCDAAWWAAGSVLGEFPVMDHAWLFGPGDGAREPWGFVTEPYMDLSAAEAVVERARHVTDAWGVDYLTLDKSLSSWNPGGCVSIVAFVRSGHFGWFIKSAIKWILSD